MKPTMMISLMLICLLSTSGCVLVGSVSSDPAKSSLPRESQKIGGGFEISYEMPEDGTILLIDRTTGKTVQTVTLKEGETFDFACRASDAKIYQTMGIDIQRADFVLYAYPRRQKTASTSTSSATAQSAMLIPAPQYYTPQLAQK